MHKPSYIAAFRRRVTHGQATVRGDSTLSLPPRMRAFSASVVAQTSLDHQFLPSSLYFHMDRCPTGGQTAMGPCYLMQLTYACMHAYGQKRTTSRSRCARRSSPSNVFICCASAAAAAAPRAAAAASARADASAAALSRSADRSSCLHASMRENTSARHACKQSTTSILIKDDTIYARPSVPLSSA